MRARHRESEYRNIADALEAIEGALNSVLAAVVAAKGQDVETVRALGRADAKLSAARRELESAPPFSDG